MSEQQSPLPEAAAEWVPTGSLSPWADNPRINDHAVDQVARSIKRFGWGAPIVARRADSTVIAGHTRLKAAIKLGLDKVPVRFVDLDPVDSKLLALADNKVGEAASWDTEGLADVLRSLQAEDADLDLGEIGFSEDEIDSLLGQWEDPYATGGDPDADLHDEGVTRISISVANTDAAKIHAILREGCEAAGVKYKLLSS